MFKILKIVALIICILGIICVILLKNKYKNNQTSKEKIIKYFQDNNITSFEKAIKAKDLSKEIIKNPYLLIMVQDKTLTFKNGKYFLNKIRKWKRFMNKKKLENLLW